MVVDQNFLKVKISLVTIFLFIFCISYSFAENLNFKKIVNLKGPWGSTFISDTELLITEKSGEIKLIDLNTNKISSLNHNLNYLEHGQGGLLDILFKDDFVYIAYTENRGNWKTSTSIAKSKLNKKDLEYQIAHNEGNYFCTNDQLKEIEDNNQIAIYYCDQNGNTNDQINPNGSIKNIAGIFNKEKNVLGMMPHPERMIDKSLSGEDGSIFFKNLLNNIK